jgi:hypothetical protein
MAARKMQGAIPTMAPLSVTMVATAAMIEMSGEMRRMASSHVSVLEENQIVS